MIPVPTKAKSLVPCCFSLTSYPIVPPKTPPTWFSGGLDLVSRVYSFEVGVIQKLRSAISKLRIFLTVRNIYILTFRPAYDYRDNCLSMGQHATLLSEVCIYGAIWTDISELVLQYITCRLQNVLWWCYFARMLTLCLELAVSRSTAPRTRTVHKWQGRWNAVLTRTSSMKTWFPP